ncbi:ABC transporter ATP-binding protein [Persicimonas caeni]|uniref:ABC transporter ATP-binding protein n=1 Tax=Persicimonas caeni TaxID=2292766 RepID=A0A4Y6PTP0_PERCE|nr:ABC transporter ATP-binding protein [Persicimonas caeni]QDG51706.1 ABC transporter ATP-binding protein [Persicimonas caeni]QED32927.1 ABC transporter ATP-binding protein [Persicimonas caeni]
MNDVAISVDQLSKRYRIGTRDEQQDTLIGALNSWLKAPLKNFRRIRRLSRFDGPQADDLIWALREVSFEVARGEVLGVIGRNGAGKSTLLKVLSRITEPSSGRAVLNGRVASLLEVGTGFHSELTGRDNIFLNGTILGMSKAEISEKFDEIVAFSGVGKFIDTPVKRYSSGMRVRLAFSVAAHLEPEILLIDEVLAVGDIAFQKKCLGKMEEVASQGRTILFVSHDMGAVSDLCDRTVLLDEGELVCAGPTDEVISHYFATVDQQMNSDGSRCWSDLGTAPGGEQLRLCQIALRDSTGRRTSTMSVQDPITIEFVYRVLEEVRGMRFVMKMRRATGELVLASTDHLQRTETLSPGVYRGACQIPGKLLNRGRYYITLHAGIPGQKVLLQGQEWVGFTAEGQTAHGSRYPEKWPGVVAPELEWQVDEPLVDSREQLAAVAGIE